MIDQVDTNKQDYKTIDEVMVISKFWQLGLPSTSVAYC